MKTGATSKLIYRSENILENEAKIYADTNNRDTYMAIATAFPLPPVGCDQQTYLRARNRASYVMTWWRDRCRDAGVLSDLERIEQDQFVRAVILFELTNFLVSAGIRETALFFTNSNGEITHQGMRGPSYVALKDMKKISIRAQKALKILTSLKKDVEVLGYHTPPALDEAARISDAVSRLCTEGPVVGSRKKIKVLNGNAFEVLTQVSPGARPNEVIKNILVFNLSELFYHCLRFSNEKSYALLIPLLNSLTDPAHPEATPKLNVEALKKRKISVDECSARKRLSASYQAIILKIPDDRLCDSVRRFKKVLDYPNK